MTSEQAFKIEVYYRDRSVFKAGYHDNLEEAGRSAAESLDLDESVYEVRILDHGGKVLDTFKKEEG